MTLGRLAGTRNAESIPIPRQLATVSGRPPFPTLLMPENGGARQLRSYCSASVSGAGGVASSDCTLVGDRAGVSYRRAHGRSNPAGRAGVISNLPPRQVSAVAPALRSAARSSTRAAQSGGAARSVTIRAARAQSSASAAAVRDTATAVPSPRRATQPSGSHANPPLLSTAERPPRRAIRVSTRYRCRTSPWSAAHQLRAPRRRRLPRTPARPAAPP